MRAAIYPGTFDPPTLGHLNIIQRGSKQFDRLIIAIGKNPAKSPLFSVEERVAFLKEITKEIPQIEICPFDGLLVDFAKSKKIDTILRAIRTIFDFENETLQAQINHKLGNLETLYLVVDEKYRLISSQLVREIAAGGKRLSDFVPPAIEAEVFKRLSQ